MGVKTKYEFGDKVWYIKNNQILNKEITGFIIHVDKNGPDIKYWVDYEDTLHDNELFETREELLNTL